MRVSVDTCRYRTLLGIDMTRVLIKDGINLIHIIIDTISSQENHIADRFNISMAMCCLLHVGVPVDLVLARVCGDHLAKSLGHTGPEISIELGSRACLEWDLLHLK